MVSFISVNKSIFCITKNLDLNKPGIKVSKENLKKEQICLNTYELYIFEEKLKQILYKFMMKCKHIINIQQRKYYNNEIEKFP